MKRYVIVYVANPFREDKILLVTKDKPEWQKGKLNLLGGKVEDDEIPAEAAIRELKEESGLETRFAPHYFGRIEGDEYIVYCYCIIVDSNELNPRPEETQEIDWYNWYDVKNYDNLIPNLKLIIPLIRCDVDNWVINQINENNLKVMI